MARSKVMLFFLSLFGLEGVRLRNAFAGTKKGYVVLVLAAAYAIVTGGQVNQYGKPVMVETAAALTENGTPKTISGVSLLLTFSTGSTTGSTSTTSTSGNAQGQAGGATATGTSSGTTGTTSSTGSTSGGTGTSGGNWYYFMATPGGGYNTNWSMNGDSNPNATLFSRSVPVGPAVNNVFTYTSAQGYPVVSGDQVFMADTGLGSNDVMTTWQEYETEVTNPVPTYTHYFWRTDYKLIKVPYVAISVDSRRAFGQPDITGETPADPNAPSRNVCFNPWMYNGGLFVGNMPTGQADQSGTARIQLSPSGTFPTLVNPQVADFAMAYNGMPPAANAGFTLGLYTPATNDPNINQNQSTVTWSTAWALPTSSIGSAALASNAPSAILNMGTSPVNQNLILAVNNESAFVTAGSEGWAYFANPAYGSGLPGPAGPWTNCQPEVWILDAVNTTAYWKYTDTNP